MRPRPLRAWLWLAIAVLCQMALGVVWPTLSWMPDLIGAVVVAAAMENDAATALLIGLVAGAWQDLSLGRLLGLHASLWALSGYLISTLQRRISSESWLVTAWVGLIALFVERLVEWVVLSLVGIAVDPVGALFAGTVVSVPFVLLFRRLLHVQRRSYGRVVP